MHPKNIPIYHRALFALMLAALLLGSIVPAAYAAETSGSCGDDLTWSVTDGVLTIEGSGAMWHFYETDMAPWYPYRESIIRIQFPEGLTSVGNLAFYDCSKVAAVDLPETVRSVGEYAFASCEKIAILDLGSSLTAIGAGAFHGCVSLCSVVLPGTLNAIGNEAFYMCAGLTAITIPESVTVLGNAAFAYCTSLVRAEVKSPMTVLPDWTFFGCTMLNTVILPETVTQMGNSVFRECDNLCCVSYGGTSMDMGELKENIAEDVPGFSSVGNVTADVPSGSTSSGNAAENPDGTVTEQITTVMPGENASVSSTVEQIYHPDSENTVNADITITIENEEGWSESQENLENALGDVQNKVQPGTSVETTRVTVYVKDSSQIDDGFVAALAGRNVELNIVSQDGSAWTIDCRKLVVEDLTGTYDLRYILENANEADLKTMNVSQGYLLRFSADAQVNAEVQMRLADSTIRQTATLFERRKDGVLIRHQSVVVDADGLAHFFLGSVSASTEYLVGINVPGVEKDAIIPESLQGEYAAMDYAEPVEYVITGRTSSWGLEIGQVTWILIGVMVGSIVIVGFVMFRLNKRRLQNGYVPDLQDEDE